VLGAEFQGLGAQAGGAIGHTQADQVGLAGAGEIRVHFNGSEYFLLLLVHRHQLVGGGQLSVKGAAGFAVYVHVPGFHAVDIAQGGEGAIRKQAAHVFQPDAGAVLGAVVAVGHLVDPVPRDLAAVSGLAFNGHAVVFGKQHRFGSGQLGGALKSVSGVRLEHPLTLPRLYRGRPFINVLMV